MPKLSQIRKAITTGVGFALAALAVAAQYGDLLPPQWANGIAIAIACLTPVATFLIPNTPTANAPAVPG